MIRYFDKNIGFKAVGDDGIARYTGEEHKESGGKIYKNYDAFNIPHLYPSTEIVYIPESAFPNGKTNFVPEEEITGYTRNDLIKLTGSRGVAEILFESLSWQAPETKWVEDCADSDENGFWIEAHQAYEEIYLEEFDRNIDRFGQEPVCYDEFFDNEWQDKEYRQYCIAKLLGANLIDEQSAIDAVKDLDDDGTENIEEVIYTTLVRDNVEREFERFHDDEIDLSPEQIFSESYKIQFYKEVSEYICNPENPLDYEHYKALSIDGENLLSHLYYDAMDRPNSVLGDNDKILTLIDDYARTAHKEIFKEESALE